MSEQKPPQSKTALPKWATDYAEEVRSWFIQPDAGKFAVDGFNAGVRLVLERLEATRERDDIETSPILPNSGQRLDSDRNEYRDELRAEVLGE